MTEQEQQSIINDSKLECHEFLSHYDVPSCATLGSEETTYSDVYIDNDEKNRITRLILNDGGALLHINVILNYLEQENEISPVEKMMLRNFRSKFR